MKEFQEQQEQMQKQMGETNDPMAMFSKLLSGDLGPAEPQGRPQQRVQDAPASSGSGKRAKKQQSGH